MNSFRRRRVDLLSGVPRQTLPPCTDVNLSSTGSRYLSRAFRSDAISCIVGVKLCSVESSGGFLAGAIALSEVALPFLRCIGFPTPRHFFESSSALDNSFRRDNLSSSRIFCGSDLLNPPSPALLAASPVNHRSLCSVTKFMWRERDETLVELGCDLDLLSLGLSSPRKILCNCGYFLLACFLGQSLILLLLGLSKPQSPHA